MHRLGWPDAQHDPQDLDAGYALRQRWIEARPSLFDSSEVKSSRVGNGLNVLVGCQVRIGSGNCGMLVYRQTGNGLWERITEIRVLRAAAIASPPTGVDGQLHQIRESRLAAGPGRSAAFQRAKLLQIDDVRALRCQVRINEILMRKFILGIVMNILRHIGIEDLQRSGIRWTTTSSRDLAILDSSEFVVLYP